MMLLCLSYMYVMMPGRRKCPHVRRPDKGGSSVLRSLFVCTSLPVCMRIHVHCSYSINVHVQCMCTTWSTCTECTLAFALISPPPPSRQDPLEFRLSELKKHFVVGDHVKVIAGRHEGETGLVVRIESNLAVLLSDLTLQEVC